MRNRTLASLAAVMILAAACSDRSPVTPEDPLTRATAATAASAATCDAAGVRLGITATLVDRSTRTRATALFNDGWSRDRGGNHAAARVGYYATLNVVLGAHALGRTREPRSMSTREAINGVAGLTRAIYRCAGDAPPADLADILGMPPVANDGNHMLCTGAGDVGTTCVIPAERVAVVAEPGFLRAPALFILEPAPSYIDPAFEGAYGTQWSRSWSARVVPVAAQANYPVATPGAPAAVVAVCVADRLIGGTVTAHPSRSLLQIATRPEDTPAASPQLLPVQSLLGGQDVTALLDCDQPGGPIAGRGLLDEFRATAHRLLAPRPLYAFDGGIGGRVSAFRSYYAAVRPPAALFVFSAAMSSSGGPPPSPIANGTLTLAAGTMIQLLVSTSSDSFAAATGCRWGYRPPDTAGAARLFSNALLAQHAGTTWLRATCDAGTVDLQVVVP